LIILSFSSLCMWRPRQNKGKRETIWKLPPRFVCILYGYKLHTSLPFSTKETFSGNPCGIRRFQPVKTKFQNAYNRGGDMGKDLLSFWTFWWSGWHCSSPYCSHKGLLLIWSLLKVFGFPVWVLLAEGFSEWVLLSLFFFFLFLDGGLVDCQRSTF
jgi:hypothetical protein